MKIITLSNSNKVAIIDDIDYEIVSKFNWWLHRDGYALGNKGSKTFVKMHRLIMNTDKGMSVDHINHDRLDNRRANLRNVSHAFNMRNGTTRVNNTSGYRGVSRFRDKWRAYVTENNKQVHLGFFLTVTEAIDARKTYERKVGI